MSIKPTLAILITILIAVVIVSVQFHLSLWFLWYLLPSGDLKIAVNSSQPGSQTVSNLVSSIPLRKDSAGFITNVKRYALVKTEEYSAIAAVPKNPFLFKDRNSLISQFHDNNWRTLNFGLVIIGTDNNFTIELSSLKTVVINTYRKITSNQHPFKPVVIAENKDKALPLISGQAALVGIVSDSSKGQELKIIIAPDLDNLPNFSITGPALPAQNNYLSFNVPGLVLQSIPAHLAQQWSQTIYQAFGFTATKPPILGYLADHQATSLTVTNDEAALAVIGDPQALKDTFNQWIENEEAYSRPQRHAFRLPDKSLGYELIKGDYQPVLSEADQSGCHNPTSDAVQLWLCLNNQGVSVATNRDAALRELSSVSPSLQTVVVGSAYLRKIDYPPVKHIQSLTLFSSGKYTVLTAQLSPHKIP